MTVDYSDARWRKSSRSGNEGQCVEVADLGNSVGLRDSKNPDGPKLVFTTKEITEFAARIKAGRLDG